MYLILRDCNVSLDFYIRVGILVLCIIASRIATNKRVKLNVSLCKSSNSNMLSAT
jgi:hypothetical protein